MRRKRANMYGQYQNQIASAAKWVFLGFVIIIIMAFLIGADFKDTTWLNSSIAEAQAERIKIETEHQHATYEMEERLTAAQTEAEIQAIQRDQKMLDAKYDHDIQMLNQAAINSQRWTDTTISLVVFIGRLISVVAAIITLVIVVTKAAAIRSSHPKPAVAAATAAHREPTIHTGKALTLREPYDPWTSPLFRRQKREAARKEELDQRRVEIRVREFSDPAHISSEEYKKKPLAG